MTQNPKNHYQTLGLPRTATTADILRAFRSLAKAHHPDISRDPNATRNFQGDSPRLQDPLKRGRTAPLRTDPETSRREEARRQAHPEANQEAADGGTRPQAHLPELPRNQESRVRDQLQLQA